MLANMLQEPEHYRRRDADDGFRFLVHSHTLLGYLSALGAHRHRLDAKEADAQLLPNGERIAGYLAALAERLERRQPVAELEAEREALLTSLEQEVLQSPEEEEQEYRPMHGQLLLVARQLTPLSEAAERLVAMRDRPEREALNAAG